MFEKIQNFMGMLDGYCYVDGVHSRGSYAMYWASTHGYFLYGYHNTAPNCMQNSPFCFEGMSVRVLLERRLATVMIVYIVDK